MKFQWNLKQILAWAIYLLIGFTVIWGLGQALIPLLIAFVLAYLLFPVVEKIERYKVSRTWAILGSFAVLGLIFFILALLIVPRLIEDGKTLAHEFPNKFLAATIRIEQLAGEFGFEIAISKDSLREFLVQKQELLSTQLVAKISSGAFAAFTGFTSWLLTIMSFLLIPLFFYYLIHDFEKNRNNVKEFIPVEDRESFFRWAGQIDVILSGYIRGQLSVAGILAILYGLGLTMIGLQFGFVIGLVSGLLSVIPYVGFTFGFVTSLAVALANGGDHFLILGVVIVFGLVQALEGTVITPKLVGDKVGLSPLTTILVLIIGGNVAGLIGMLVAIPLAAILKFVLIELKPFLWRSSHSDL